MLKFMDANEEVPETSLIPGRENPITRWIFRVTDRSAGDLDADFRLVLSDEPADDRPHMKFVRAAAPHARSRRRR